MTEEQKRNWDIYRSQIKRDMVFWPEVRFGVMVVLFGFAAGWPIVSFIGCLWLLIMGIVDVVLGKTPPAPPFIPYDDK